MRVRQPCANNRDETRFTITKARRGWQNEENGCRVNSLLFKILFKIFLGEILHESI